MMRALFVGSLFVLVACAAAPAPAPAVPSAATAPQAAPPEKTPAQEWGEKKAESEPAPAQAKSAAPEKENEKESLDPLASSELEESSLPNTEITPPKQVRAKRPRELNAALASVKSARSVDEAVKKLTKRLGKPTWTETPKGSSATRRVWVANAKNQCHRLVLEADGSVDVETMKKDDWRMLTATARQNPCTGEIKRGISK
jgi:hypothetical protein